TDRSYLLGSAFPKPYLCFEPFALVRSMLRAAFSQCRPKDWRLILTTNTEKTIPNNRTHIIKFRVTEKENSPTNSSANGSTSVCQPSSVNLCWGNLSSTPFLLQAAEKMP